MQRVAVPRTSCGKQTRVMGMITESSQYLVLDTCEKAFRWNKHGTVFLCCLKPLLSGTSTCCTGAHGQWNPIKSVTEVEIKALQLAWPGALGLVGVAPQVLMWRGSRQLVCPKLSPWGSSHGSSGPWEAVSWHRIQSTSACAPRPGQRSHTLTKVCQPYWCWTLPRWTRGFV